MARLDLANCSDERQSEREAWHARETLLPIVLPNHNYLAQLNCETTAPLIAVLTKVKLFGFTVTHTHYEAFEHLKV